MPASGGGHLFRARVASIYGFADLLYELRGLHTAAELCHVYIKGSHLRTLAHQLRGQHPWHPSDSADPGGTYLDLTN